MKRSLKSCLLLTAICPLGLPVAGTVYAQEAGAPETSFWGNWTLDGTLRGKYEYYDISGDLTAAPYRFLGSTGFVELDFSAINEISAYEFIEFNGHVLLNDSDYRSRYDGITLERFKFAWEKGDGDIPFRLEGGDIYGRFSNRVLQRAMKGLQLDLQPDLGGGDYEHSFMLVGGVQQSVYRDLADVLPTFAGASLTRAKGKEKSWGLHAAYHATDTENANEQIAMSATHARKFNVKDQDLSFSGEIAYLSGDDRAGAAKLSDFSGFVSFSGRDKKRPLDYRFRYELAGDEYRPLGANAAANREAIQGQLGYRFEAGHTLGLRAERYSDNRFSGIERRTHVAEASLTGPLSFIGSQGANGRISATYQDILSENRLQDQDIWTLRTNVSAPLKNEVTASVSGFFQNRKDHMTGDSTRSLTSDASLAFRAAALGWDWSLRPGVFLRHTDSATQKSTDLGFQMSLSANAGPHDISFNMQHTDQDRFTTVQNDLRTSNFSARYTHTIDNKRFGVEADFRQRDPFMAQDTESYRISLFAELAFSYAPKPTDRQTAPTSNVDQDLSLITPGSLADEARNLYMRYGSPIQIGQMFIYEEPLLYRVRGRQRLVFEENATRIRRSGAIIDLEDGRFETIFSDILNELLDIYGNPDSSFEDGQFSGNLSEDLRTGRFARNYDWRVLGGYIRLGIPARLDGQVRAEIIFTQTAISPQDSYWGFETIY